MSTAEGCRHKHPGRSPNTARLQLRVVRDLTLHLGLSDYGEAPTQDGDGRGSGSGIRGFRTCQGVTLKHRGGTGEGSNLGVGIRLFHVE